MKPHISLTVCTVLIVVIFLESFHARAQMRLWKLRC